MPTKTVTDEQIELLMSYTARDPGVCLGRRELHALRALLADHARLKKELAQIREAIGRDVMSEAAIEKENDWRDALEFYANPWHTNDAGVRAQAALGKTITGEKE